MRALRFFRRHAAPLVGTGLVLGVFVLAPVLGFATIMQGEVIFGPSLFSATQWEAVRETVLLMLGVSLLVGTIGLGSAWLVSIYDFPLRRYLEIGLFLPLAFPTYLAAFVAVELLHFFGPVQSLWRWLIGAKTVPDYRFFEIRSLGGAIFILGLTLFPYVYVPCRILFSQTGRTIIEAARLLGASGWGLFFRVGVPLAQPAIGAGLILALLETLNDIGATEHLGVSSLSVAIRDMWLTRGDLPGAARLAGLLMALVILLLLVDSALRRSRRTQVAGRSSVPPQPTSLRGWKGWLATSVCLLPVLLGFLVPTFYLSGQAAFYSSKQSLDPQFLRAAATTFGLGLAVSLLVMATGAALAIAVRLAGTMGWAGIVATFGYAIPGTVLVLALLPVLRYIDEATSLFGLKILISGSSLAVLYALGVRFLGIGTGQAALALTRLPVNVDHVGRIHGLGDLRLAVRVYLPTMVPGLLLGGTLVFIDTVKELPATILLRPLNFETLATRAYQQASAGLFEHAALDSLMILVLSGAAALLLSRR